MTRRILVVAPWVPSERRPRSFGLIRMLAMSHDVRVIAAAWSPSDVADAERLASLVDVRVIRLSHFGGLLRVIAAVPSSRSFQQAFTGSPRFERAIAAQAKDFQPDMTYFNVIRSANHVAAAHGSLVIDLDEFRSDYYRQLAGKSSNLVWRRIAASERKRMAAAEKVVMQNFGTILISSPAELDEMNPHIKLVRSPHALRDLGGGRIAKGDNSIVFVGRLSYRANREALKWFVREVLPELVRRIPTTRLRVVGAGVGRDILRLGSEHVQIIGRVDDVTPYYMSARASIVPIAMATGVQMKLIESAAVGVPIVTTPPLAMRAGLDPDTECFVATSPEQWVSQLQAVLSDPIVAQARGDAARRWASRVYSEAEIRQSLMEALGFKDA